MFQDQMFFFRSFAKRFISFSEIACQKIFRIPNWFGKHLFKKYMQYKHRSYKCHKALLNLLIYFWLSRPTFYDCSPF